ncbi:MAG: hypothetical protein ABW034_10610, partial [Steroidobacteraceae bacterium]
MEYQTLPDYMSVPLYQMPLTAQTVMLYVFSVLGVVTLLWSLYRSKVEQSLAPLMYCIGGAITCFLEPIFTRLLDATHAQIGQQVAYEALGQVVPWHAAISYTFYFGFAYLYLIPAFKEKRYTARAIWIIVVAVTASAWLYEVPLIRIGLWKYYGEQPYQIFGVQPFYWSAASGAMLLVPTALIALFAHRLQGWRSTLIVPLASIGAMGTAAGTCWPIWFALNSPYGYGFKVVCATLTILFSILV